MTARYTLTVHMLNHHHLNKTNKTQLVLFDISKHNTTDTQPITFQTTLMTYYKTQLMNHI
jgi:hypothetical protein